MARFKPLALIGADRDDLQTISALLQDAIVKIGDIAYQRDEHRFALMANRYCWERAKTGLFGRSERVRTGVHFDDVKAVRAKSVRMEAKEAVIDILSIGYEGGVDGGTILLNLAGGGEIALEVDAINVMLKDLSEPWRAASRPDHEGATA